MFDKKNTPIQSAHESPMKCHTIKKERKICDWHSEKSHLLCASQMIIDVEIMRHQAKHDGKRKPKPSGQDARVNLEMLNK